MGSLFYSHILRANWIREDKQKEQHLKIMCVLQISLSVLKLHKIIPCGCQTEDYLAMKYIRKWLVLLPSPAIPLIFLPSHRENSAPRTGFPWSTSECIPNRVMGVLQHVIYNQKHFPCGQVPWHTLGRGQTAVVFLRFRETGITSLLQVTNGDVWLLAPTAAVGSAEQKLLSSEQAEIRQKKSRMPQNAALLEPLAFNLKIRSVLGLWIEAPVTRVGLVGWTSLEAQWEQRPSGHGQSVAGFGQYHTGLDVHPVLVGKLRNSSLLEKTESICILRD